MNRSTLVACAVLFFAASGPVWADEIIGHYDAYIGEEDLYNSNGERLREPWQVLRQDRANYHKYGIRQRDDGDDDFFSSAENRALMEQMVRDGSMEPEARRLLLRGHVHVHVDIYGHGNRGTSVDVTVDDN